ncbi:MAG: hypothetical protein JWM33_2196 [Caulobacteraceae bacterium]|nr:hypothetical protein [Caulobacteraceae bacterium]
MATPPPPQTPPAADPPGWSPDYSRKSPWEFPVSPTPPTALPAKPVTRLQLKSPPMIALAFLASALAAFLLPAMAMIGVTSAVHQAMPAMLAALAMIFGFGLALQGVAQGAVLWTLGRRKLARSGRRWFVLAGLAAGFVQGAAMVLPALIRQPREPAMALTLALIFTGALSLSGALGGLLFSLAATRRAPLETLFD